MQKCGKQNEKTNDDNEKMSEICTEMNFWEVL